MATREQDILLDMNNDLHVQNGDFAIGESIIQETGLILLLNQGELKSDALLGPNLVTNIRQGSGEAASISKVKLHLARDGKRYEDIKKYIQITGEKN